jgi:hypothetical protein
MACRVQPCIGDGVALAEGQVTKDFCKQQAPKWPFFPVPLYTASRSSFFSPLSQANPIPLVHRGD